MSLAVRQIQRDGDPVEQAQCPRCYTWSDADLDQLTRVEGEQPVSLICVVCGWHGFTDGSSA
jgi:RNase P subunit RPR2